LVGVVGILFATGAAQATTTAVFSGSLNNRAARAEFVYGDGSLQVTLTNTSPDDVLVPSEVLTAVFFDVDPLVTFTRVSAMLASGSEVFFGLTDPGGVVGGEFAFNSGLSGAPGNAVLGLSSSGFDLFGPPDLFPGTDLQEPESPDGIQYGITSAGDDMTTGNTPVTGTNALIKNSVVFQLTYEEPANPLRIYNVWFQYGTDLTEPSIPSYDVGEKPPVIPEPFTLISCFLAVSGLGVFTTGG
jgi:hypothetical protein